VPYNGLSRGQSLRARRGTMSDPKGYRLPVEGRLMILSGPSGVGKDTVLDAWRVSNHRVQRVVAATSRPPRVGEVDGIDYHFLTREAFLAMVENGELLEYKEVFENLYGTPKLGLEKLLGEGKIAVLKIDVQGALEVMSKRPDAVSIFLLPPDDATLESRLRNRSTDTEAVVELRLKNAKEEIAIGMNHYSHRVVNANVDQAVKELEEIVNG
jgi:guanylate kinase